MSPVRTRPKTTSDFARSERAAKYILSKSRLRPKIAVVLGSGLGAFADELAGATRIPYGKIPGFPKPTADGHAGRLVIGKVNEVPIAVMQGRVHFYEGYSMKDVVYPMRVLWQLGIQSAILTNAGGAINLSFKPGDLVLMRDHIGLHTINPLIGPNEERFGTKISGHERGVLQALSRNCPRGGEETRHAPERGRVRGSHRAQFRNARGDSLSANDWS